MMTLLLILFVLTVLIAVNGHALNLSGNTVAFLVMLAGAMFTTAIFMAQGA